MSVIFLRIACSLFLLLAPLSVALPAGVPKAVFSETQFAFGQVMMGTAVEHEFVLRNEGDAPLRIMGVRTTSSLLLSRMPAQITPKAEAKLRIQLDTSKLSGQFKGEIQVSLNDPAMPEAILLFEGRVIPPIELSPHPQFFVAGQRGERRQSAIEIINHEPEPLRIESVDHPLDRFTTKIETIREGQRYRLTLILNPAGPGEKKTETILVKTSSRTMPLLSIPAHTYLRERVYTFPGEVDLGSLELADIKAQPRLLEKTAQTLMVYQSGGSDFRVKLRTDLPMLDLKWERGPKGDRYQATITLIGEKLRVGPIKGSIIIETNDTKFPTIRVPVTGSILETKKGMGE
jgi:hypothetical protein